MANGLDLCLVGLARKVLFVDSGWIDTVVRPIPVPLISSLFELEILLKMSCLLTVCDMPESSSAKISVVPDPIRNVGRDLHVGSPFTLLICSASHRRLQWLGPCMLCPANGLIPWAVRGDCGYSSCLLLLLLLRGCLCICG